MAARASSKHVWALDFDGVACDSVGESATSAWDAAAGLWPELFAGDDARAKKDSVLASMRAVRPVIETGYENLVQVRCLLEGVSVDAILEDWPTLLKSKMGAWALERADLVARFGTTRDAWMERDLEGWLGANGMYEGVPAVLKACQSTQEAYVVTTKQARFTAALLTDAGVPFADERIFSQTVSGRPKGEVLSMLAGRHPGAAGYHFVEDKLSTLEAVAKDAGLAEWRLYLVDWGYNTPAERARASASSRIQVMSVADLAAAVAGG